MSTPNGAGFIFLASIEDQLQPVGYHRASFGEKGAHFLDTRMHPEDDVILIALGSADHQLAVHLSTQDEKIITRRLIVQKETSDLQLRAAATAHRSAPEVQSENDCLLRCFDAMWTRFPVVAAIERDNLSSEARRPRSLTLVREHDVSNRAAAFDVYWREMIRVRPSQI